MTINTHTKFVFARSSCAMRQINRDPRPTGFMTLFDGIWRLPAVKWANKQGVQAKQSIHC
jgi:hypothetical protein